jgi:2-dehydro-3-deoxy-D-pentonate aldolase
VLRGIIAPSVTIFRNDGSLDAEANRIHTDFLISHGVHAMHVLGTTGEFMHMNLKEREQHATEMCQHIDGRVPVIVGTGTSSTRETMRLSRHAQGVGADAVSVITPYFWGLSEREIIGHYSAVANAIDIPIIVNNYPAATGINVSTETLAALAREHRNITAVVDSIDSIEHFRQRVTVMKSVNPEFIVLAGYDLHLLSILEIGGDGTVPATANVAPALHVEMYDAWVRHDFETVHSLLPRLMAIVAMHQVPGSFLSVIKEAITMCGVGKAGSPRQPALPLSTESRARLRDVLDRANLLSTTSDA